MPIRIAPLDPAALRGTANADPAVLTALREASAATGTRFDTLLASASLESGLQPQVRAATSSASGLFQFTEGTWLRTVRQYGAAHGLGAEAASVTGQGGGVSVADPAMRQRILAMRNDPRISALLAGDHLRGVAEQIQAHLGRAPDAAEVYLGHFLGSAGAVQMLQARPDQAAASVLPAAAQANAAMFYAPDGTALTAAQFVAAVRDRVSRTYTSIGATMPSGPLDFAGRTTGAGSADPPDAGASGWGVGTPRRVMSSSETLVLATLADVVGRMDRSGNRSSGQGQGRQPDTLPAAVLSALQGAGGG